METIKIIEVNKNLQIGYNESRTEVLIKAKKDLISDLPQVLRKYSINIENKAGIYFIPRDGVLYIGESKHILKRSKQHENFSEEFKWITFAFSGHEFELYEKHDVRDLEAIMIKIAEESGIELKNKRNENRKFVNNKIASFSMKETAKRVWKIFQMMNIDQVIDNYRNAHDDLISNIEETSNNKNDGNLKKNGKQPPLEELITYQIVEKYDFADNPIFKYIDHIDYYPKSYLSQKRRIFNDKLSEKALFEFLYENKNDIQIEKHLNPKAKSPRGFIMANTLAKYQISTRGQMGKLSQNDISEEKAKELIKGLMENI